MENLNQIFIAPIINLFKSRYRKKLRFALRGYRYLINNKSLDKISKVNSALADLEFNIAQPFFSKLLMGIGAQSGKVVVKQYLLTRLLGIKLNQTLLCYFGKTNSVVIYPLPRFWRLVLEEHDFKVAHLRSEILWQCYIFAMWIYGIKELFKVFNYNLIIKKNIIPYSDYVYFSDLDSSNIPKKNSRVKNYDVITWYLQSSEMRNNIKAIRHNVIRSECNKINGIEIAPQASPLPIFDNYLKLVKYLLWSFCAVVFTFFDLLRGRWWHPLILNQTALSYQARKLPAKSLAREYLFHNSTWIYRPLWTYDAEQYGSKITLYFYSTNIENFKRRNSDMTPIHYGYTKMSWPRFLVWDLRQRDFIKKCISYKATIKIVGPIWFSDNISKNINLSHKNIAIFDVQPVRDSFYKLLCLNFLDNEYFVPKVANNFLLDIYDIVEHQGFFMSLKRKRDIGKLMHTSYRIQLKKLDKLPNFMALDSDIAGIRVIKSSVAVISAPFTSTAHLGIYLGKPSAYYDPTGKIRKDDPAAHGVKVLSSKNELLNWIKKIEVDDNNQ